MVSEFCYEVLFRELLVSAGLSECGPDWPHRVRKSGPDRLLTPQLVPSMLRIARANQVKQREQHTSGNADEGNEVAQRPESLNKYVASCLGETMHRSAP